jgi:hypothetical protein
MVLMTIAGLASAFCSFWGVFGWMWGGAWQSHSIAAMLFFIFPALSLLTFVSYLLFPRVGLVAAWSMASGTYISLFLMNLADCRHGGCTTTTVFGIAWGIITGFRRLWIYLVAPICILLDYTAMSIESLPPVSGPGDVQDLRE